MIYSVYESVRVEHRRCLFHVAVSRSGHVIRKRRIDLIKKTPLHVKRCFFSLKSRKRKATDVCRPLWHLNITNVFRFAEVAARDTYGFLFLIEI